MIKIKSIVRDRVTKHRLSHQGRDNQMNFGLVYELIFKDVLSFDEYVKVFNLFRSTIYTKALNEYNSVFVNKPKVKLDSAEVLNNIESGYIYAPNFERLSDGLLDELVDKSISNPEFNEYLASRELSIDEVIRYGVFSNLIIDDKDLLFLTGGYPHPDTVKYHLPDNIHNSIAYSIKNWNKSSSKYNSFIGSHSRVTDFETIKFISTVPDALISVINQTEYHHKLLITEGCQDAITFLRYHDIDTYVLALSSGYATDLQSFQIMMFIDQYNIDEVILSLDNDNVGFTNNWFLYLLISKLKDIKIKFLMHEPYKDLDDMGSNKFELIEASEYIDVFKRVLIELEPYEPSSYNEHINNRKLNIVK